MLMRNLDGRRLRRLPLVLVTLAAMTLLACGDTSDDGDTEAAERSEMPPESESESEGTPATLLDPEPFAARVANPEAMVVNVHIPYEGEIEGTDAHIAFDKIKGDERLPADKAAEIVLYCRSGRMSVTAAKTLAAEGYSNLYDLEGGMKAWEQAGKPLLHLRADDPAY